MALPDAQGGAPRLPSASSSSSMLTKPGGGSHPGGMPALATSSRLLLWPEAMPLVATAAPAARVGTHRVAGATSAREALESQIERLHMMLMRDGWLAASRGGLEEKFKFMRFQVQAPVRPLI